MRLPIHWGAVSTLRDCNIDGIEKVHMSGTCKIVVWQWLERYPLFAPDTSPLQDVLHATCHRCIVADLQSIAWAHCQDQVMLAQGSLHVRYNQQLLFHSDVLSGSGHARERPPACAVQSVTPALE